jgi:hypothetical protein
MELGEALHRLICFQRVIIGAISIQGDETRRPCSIDHPPHVVSTCKVETT